MRRVGFVVIAMWFLLAHPTGAQVWSVRQTGTVLEVLYTEAGFTSQYAALHRDSGYFRLVYGPQAGWGTSVIVMPSFWSNGAYYQGVPVATTWGVSGPDLLINVTGNNHGITADVTLRIHPPANDAIVTEVSATTTGTVPLDNRPNEAFKPLMLSSMKVATNLWDAQSAYVDCSARSIPSSGWLLYPAVTGTILGLRGGTSAWKTNAPTVEIALKQPMPITGWVTASTDPNDDNIGFWPASSSIMRSWRYTIRSAPERSAWSIGGTVVLGDYVGDVTQVALEVEIRPRPGSSYARTATVHLDNGGHYALAGVPCGYYDIAVSGDRWLRKVVRNIRVNASDADVPAVQLQGGDTDGSNSVDDADLTNVILDFGTSGGIAGTTDLDGSGVVDDADLTNAILAYGAVGDS